MRTVRLDTALFEKAVGLVLVAALVLACVPDFEQVR